MAPSPPEFLEPEEPQPRELLHGIADPITAEDLKCAMPRTSSAPGPDGVTLRQLRAVPGRVLLAIMNLFLLLGDVPPYLKVSRAVFIPKTSSPEQPSDFRPIAISSLLLRVYHRIIALRVQRLVSLDERQRAFIPADGCAENVILLSALLAESRREKRSLYLATLDLRRAFDTVTFGAVLAAAGRGGFPPTTICYLERLYSYSTVLIGAGGFERSVPVTRGVRQGDPLSPALFNLVIDGLLRSLPGHIGWRLGDAHVNALAFADDLVLCASTPDGLQELLNAAEAYLNPRGLAFNVSKCSSLSLVASGREKKVKVISHPFKLSGGELPASSLNDIWRYLGISFSPEGRSRLVLLRELRPLLERLTGAPLKPQQRLAILRTTVLPRLQYRLVLGRHGLGALKEADGTVRAAVRRWLRLPLDCPVAFYHAAVQDGGLGIPALRTSIPRLRWCRLNRMTASSLPACTAAIRTPRLCADLDWARRAATSNGLLLDTPLLCAAFWSRSLHSTIDGRGLDDSRRAPFVHTWVSDGSGIFTGRDYIDAVKLRINALATASRRARGRPSVPRGCAAGCQAVETAAHVIQHCGITSGMRSRRHDRIAVFLAGRLRGRGWFVQRERHIRTSAGLRKPDLVAWKENEIVVVDVQVVGCGRPLDQEHHRKAQKYNTPEMVTILQAGSRTPVTFTSATVSFRGIWSGDSAADLLDLGLSKADLRLATVKALQGSLSAWRWAHQATSRVHGPAAVLSAV